MTTRKPQVGDHLLAAEQFAAYEAAVEALREIADYDMPSAPNWRTVEAVKDIARAALDRLRETSR